ncbi:pinensin family lanthipeptide [Fulvivirga sp. 29W222]|uniref:Pinensin family lanthipeptide n=1 Tax=Fulvivirga marina TaxID=2494733 RepID=A0A937FTE0_9BACT|nr:pinensin family lanthipeptide [Fulvivirga marina]MBL6445495.1 pinensin family lanthipeptide [Fulvivirga marina]
MREKKKLKINDLKVNSFVTSMKEVRGGAVATLNVDCPYFKTQPKTCVESVNWCWTP